MHLAPDPLTITNLVTLLGFVVTAALAVTGYLVAYFNNVELEKRKARLKYVSDQIQYLYGPLVSLSNASDVAWQSFRSRYRPVGAFFGQMPEPTPEELMAWRMWMQEVFMRMNIQMEKIIIENAHLIEGESMPETFRDLLSHVEVYRVTMKRWEAGDYSEHTAYRNFPPRFASEVEEIFDELKRRQADLMGSR